MRPCGSCGNNTHDNVLVMNEGICNTCHDAVKRKLDDQLLKQTMEYIEIDRRHSSMPR